MTTPLQEYRSTTYDLTIRKLQQQGLERKTWLDEKLTKSVNQPTQK
jgi:hypothetical protein